MGSYSRLYSCDEKNDCIEQLSVFKSDTPLAFKIMVSVGTRLSRSFVYDEMFSFEEGVIEKDFGLVAILGDFKSGRERLFSVLKYIEKLDMFDDEEQFMHHVAVTWDYLYNEVDNEKEYALLECLDLFLMDSKDYEEQNKTLFNEITNIDNVISNFINEWAEVDNDDEKLRYLGIGDYAWDWDDYSNDFEAKWEKVKTWQPLQDLKKTVNKRATKKEKFVALVQMAEKGGAKSMHKLGETYLTGIAGVVEPNIESAIFWLQKAAKNHSEGSMQKLGEVYLYGIAGLIEPNVEKALFWFQEAYKRCGIIYNCLIDAILSRTIKIDCLLSLCMDKTSFVENVLYYYCNSGKAVIDDVKHFTKQLVDLYGNHEEKGQIIEKYLSSFLEKSLINIPFLEKLADNGQVIVQIILCKCYMEGAAGINYDQAVFWAKKADESGHPVAKDCLNQLCDNSWESLYEGLKNKTEEIKNMTKTTFRESDDVSILQLRRVAEKNVAAAQYLLAMNLPYKRKHDSKYWLQKAADQGFQPAKSMLNL